MTTEQISKLKELADRWANDPPDANNECEIAADVMDLLPDVLEHIKVVSAEREAALKALREEKEYSESLAKDICEMEDALGFKNDCTDKDGAFVPTKGPWKERVRDLIAKEGELGDAKSELDAANAKCAEMRDVLQRVLNWATTDSEFGEFTEEIIPAVGEAIKSDCGKGYIKAESLKCFKCDDGHTPLYCLNCAREGYHHNDEWKPVVEVLRVVYEWCVTDNPSDIDGDYIKQALAHAEKLIKEAQ